MTGKGEPGPEPLRLAFGIHIHQPVGNFDHVFEQHVAEVYLPFLRAVTERQFLPIALHMSGPLLEWLEGRGSPYLDLVGRLATDGQLELLLAGMYEPVLAAIPSRDRVEQIEWMREALRARFGVEARGLWLTERVWEPELAYDLARAGVRYALVDDRHFLVTGFPREQLHAPFWTEAQGQRLALFPIDERLRYLIPFRPPSEITGYLEELGSAGHRLAVFADDGEKFGGWPGTKEWVYDRGWLSQFFDALAGMRDRGSLRLSTFSQALADVPSGGLAYLPSASYREMEEWSLPPVAARRLASLNDELGEERLQGADGALVRGGHWRNFLAKYPESNRMHKKMQALSFLARERGDPPDVRRAIGRAQCNDAYWHGVFGGLYLPHLRRAIWRQLAEGEQALRRGEALSYAVLDFDADGHDEIWIRSAAFSAIVSPARGAGVEEFTIFDQGINFTDVLTRRREAYHFRAVEGTDQAGPGDTGGTPSIHELEHAVSLSALPPVDRETRALFADRILAGALRFDDFARGDYQPVRSWAERPMTFEVAASADAIEIVCRPRHAEDRALQEKRLRFGASGDLEVRYQWSAAGLPADALFSTELTLAEPVPLRSTPAEPAWTHPVHTVAKSERGLDETLQGESTTLRWPIALGRASVELLPGRRDARG